MKRKVMIILAMVSYFPFLNAQVSSLAVPEDEIPVGSVEIPLNSVPKSLTTLVNSKLDNNNADTWIKVPDKLKEYGWMYEFGDKENPVSHYRVLIKTSKGRIQGTYNDAGDLLSSQAIYKNVGVPSYIMKEFLNTAYKDWKVVADREVTRVNNDKMDNTVLSQNFRLKVEKDNKVKRLTFDYDARTGKILALRID